LSAVRRAAALCAIAAGASFPWASPASAQGGWDPVVATVKAVPQPKRAVPKRAVPAKPLATGSLPAPAKPVGPAEPTIGPAFQSFMAGTILAVQETRAPAAPRTNQQAAPQHRVEAEPRAEPRQEAAETPALTTSTARQYCVNIADAAADARFAWQKKKLLEIAQELEMRVGLLEEKIAEHRQWVTRRDEFLKKARGNLVLIYSRMRAEAAALQLVAMDEETAAAVLLKLDPRVASTILNEMEPAKAARLTSTISGAAREPRGARTADSPKGGKS
jgi:flagellar motility protein MotE (MotC chaperone)